MAMLDLPRASSSLLNVGVGPATESEASVCSRSQMGLASFQVFPDSASRYLLALERGRLGVGLADWPAPLTCGGVGLRLLCPRAHRHATTRGYRGGVLILRTIVL